MKFQNKLKQRIYDTMIEHLTEKTYQLREIESFFAQNEIQISYSIHNTVTDELIEDTSIYGIKNEDIHIDSHNQHITFKVFNERHIEFIGRIPNEETEIEGWGSMTIEPQSHELSELELIIDSMNTKIKDFFELYDEVFEYRTRFIHFVQQEQSRGIGKRLGNGLDSLNILENQIDSTFDKFLGFYLDYVNEYKELSKTIIGLEHETNSNWYNEFKMKWKSAQAVDKNTKEDFKSVFEYIDNLDKDIHRYSGSLRTYIEDKWELEFDNVINDFMEEEEFEIFTYENIKLTLLQQQRKTNIETLVKKEFYNKWWEHSPYKVPVLHNRSHKLPKPKLRG